MVSRATLIFFLMFLILEASCGWAGERPDSSPALRAALASLEELSTGKELIVRAREIWGVHSDEELLSHLREGPASKTDAVLSRYYDTETGEETRRREVTVTVRSGQSPRSLVLDLAHELLHATSKPLWDPYDPELTPGRYIRMGIDGKGGEVDAVWTECRVSLERSQRPGSEAISARCSKYYDARTATFSREAIRADFYRVGKDLEKLRQALGKEAGLFPLLSGETSSLFSSTGGASYPVSLYNEFRQLTSVACENSRRRSPASVRHFLSRRCTE